MTKLPGFLGSSYTLRSPVYDTQQTINMFPEMDELQTGKEQEPVMLVSVPGQTKILTMPKAPIRALHYTAFGSIICVAGSTIYYLNTPDKGVTWTTPTPIADLTTSTGLVSIADGIPNMYNGVANSGMISQVVVVDGSNYGVIFEEGTTNAIQLNSGNAYNGASFVTFQDGFFIFTQNIQSPTCFFASDPLNISALDTVTVNLGPDYISRIISDHDILWVFGGRSSSVWQNTGGSTFLGPDIFQQIPGSYAEGGCAFPWTIAKLSGNLFWVNSDERGYGQVFIANGYRGVRISNFAVEKWLQSFTSLDGISAWTYQDQGHSFYILNVPGSSTTWAYDLTTKQWCERAFYQAGIFNRDLINTHIMLGGANFNALHLCGDYASGNIYTLSNQVFTLNNEPIYRLRTTPHISSGYNRMFFSQLQVDLEGGIGLDGNGYAYKNGIDYTATPTPTTLTNFPLLQSGTNTYLFTANDYSTPVTPTSVSSINASGTWSNLYTISGDQVTIGETDFPISSTLFGTGNGNITNFTFIGQGGLASGSTITSANFYVNDWRGYNQQSTTPVTNQITDSEDFNAASWTLIGCKALPAAWQQYPVTQINAYRPTICTVSGGTAGTLSNQNILTTYTDKELKLNTWYNWSGGIVPIASWTNSPSTGGNVFLVYSNFGSEVVSGTLWVSMENFSNGATINKTCLAQYSIDNGTTWITPPGWINTTNTDLSRYIPLQVQLTNVDLSKFKVQIELSNPDSSSYGYLADIVILNSTDITPSSTVNVNAPDGNNTGTYLIEDTSYGIHGIEYNTPITFTNGGDISFYYQYGDKNRDIFFSLNNPVICEILGSIDSTGVLTISAVLSGSTSTLVSGFTGKIAFDVLSYSANEEGLSLSISGTTMTVSGWSKAVDLRRMYIFSSSYLLLSAAFFSMDLFTYTGNAYNSSNYTITNTKIPTTAVVDITSNQMTVNKIYSGNLVVGQTITGLNIPSGTTLLSKDINGVFTISNTLTSSLNNQIITVTANDVDTGIVKCNISFHPSMNGTYSKFCIYSSYSTDAADGYGEVYTGNGNSKLGIWGIQLSDTSTSYPYIKSSGGISGSQYITPNLTTDTISFNKAPDNYSTLYWNGTIHGASPYPVSYNATYTYDQYPYIIKNIGTNPLINLSYSDDGGHTFCPEISIPIGTVGNYTQRMIWRRLGMSRDRVFKLTCSEPIKFNIIGEDMKVKVGDANV